MIIRQYTLTDEDHEQIKKLIAKRFPDVSKRITVKNEILNPLCEKCSRAIEFCESNRCFYAELLKQNEIKGPDFGHSNSDVPPEQFL
jgi:hypothetical protein